LSYQERELLPGKPRIFAYQPPFNGQALPFMQLHGGALLVVALAVTRWLPKRIRLLWSDIMEPIIDIQLYLTLMLWRLNILCSLFLLSFRIAYRLIAQTVYQCCFLHFC